SETITRSRLCCCCAKQGMDDFKRINDTHGHEEGDRVLREVGKLLSDTFGKEYCYRYGGDEFLLIVPDISISEFNEKLGTLEPNGPAIDDTARAGFSVGFVRAMLTDSDMLRRITGGGKSKDEKNIVSADGAADGMFRPCGVCRFREYVVQERQS
ncbi:MAG: GGDEF domain-containing protein, partial [Clostridia bacterium]